MLVCSPPHHSTAPYALQRRERLAVPVGWPVQPTYKRTLTDIILTFKLKHLCTYVFIFCNPANNYLNKTINIHTYVHNSRLRILFFGHLYREL